MRVVLLAPARSLATSATIAAGVGAASSRTHFTLVNVKTQHGRDHGEDCTNCGLRSAPGYITCWIERGDRRGSNGLAAGDLRETPFQVIKRETVRHSEFVHPPLDWIQNVESGVNIRWQVNDASVIR